MSTLEEIERKIDLIELRNKKIDSENEKNMRKSEKWVKSFRKNIIYYAMFSIAIFVFGLMFGLFVL